jgi:hypothetical protein
MFGSDTVIMQKRASTGVCGNLQNPLSLVVPLQIEQNFTRFSYPTGKSQELMYVVNGNVDVRESVIFKMVGTHLF